jgi:hypothetical protein
VRRLLGVIVSNQLPFIAQRQIYVGNTTIVSIPISYDAAAPVIDKEPTVSKFC